ncbi:uncharacterized protein BDCG_01510 [Blastomyces dermatitidis ER-3]|uniref:Uncharacterized protein n=1 Tax=Ajellomyces dermatitidis (strain ER-3 / ATCC MYA-2586) TaxID=559297 RepID=A0ABP2ERR9_AJEDR|nr:uncharacterized protein BDCG_01510 [Blastomyces dermatitidis ER-3]EEQ86390.2 hypothetical protein BDCG_01510 [Blastomyces dermatitidis ER-3]
MSRKRERDSEQSAIPLKALLPLDPTHWRPWSLFLGLINPCDVQAGEPWKGQGDPPFSYSLDFRKTSFGARRLAPAPDPCTRATVRSGEKGEGREKKAIAILKPALVLSQSIAALQAVGSNGFACALS